MKKYPLWEQDLKLAKQITKQYIRALLIIYANVKRIIESFGV